MQNTSGSRRGQVFFRISPGALAEGGIAVMPKKHLTPEWFRSTRIWLILHQMQKNPNSFGSLLTWIFAAEK